MGRLSGYRYVEITRKLRAFGFNFDRHAHGSHEIWRHEENDRKITIPHHPGDMSEGTLRSILRDAAVDVEDFIKR